MVASHSLYTVYGTNTNERTSIDKVTLKLWFRDSRTYQWRSSHCFLPILPDALPALTAAATAPLFWYFCLWDTAWTRSVKRPKASGEKERMKKAEGPDLGHRIGPQIIVPEQQRAYHAQGGKQDFSRCYWCQSFCIVKLESVPSCQNERPLDQQGAKE